VDVEALKVDLLSLSAHKFYGPKGAATLYIRAGTQIAPLMHGGAQESKRRAGTENVAGIVGMGEAAVLAVGEMEEESARITCLRDRLIQGLAERVPHTFLNGPRKKARLPGNVNMSFTFIEGEALIMLLDFKNCSASTGSACSVGSPEPSHVLTAMGLSPERANSALRFSLGRYTTEADVDTLVETISEIMKKRQEMSPTYDDFKKKG
jgi:cysteine desulfurase